MEQAPQQFYQRLDVEQRCRILQFLPIDQRLRQYLSSKEWREIMNFCPDVLLSNAAPVVKWEDLKVSILLPMSHIVVDARGYKPKPAEVLGLLPLVRRVVFIIDDIPLKPGPTIEEEWYLSLINGLSHYSSTSYVFLIQQGKKYEWSMLEEDLYMSAVAPSPVDVKTFAFFIEPYPSLKEVHKEFTFSDAGDATRIISPYYYNFLYKAELGLSDPKKPPGPDNPRLKDILELFRTMCASNVILRTLMNIAMTVDDLRRNTSNRDLAMSILYPALEMAVKVGDYDKYSASFPGPYTRSGLMSLLSENSYLYDVDERVRPEGMPPGIDMLFRIDSRVSLQEALLMHLPPSEKRKNILEGITKDDLAVATADEPYDRYLDTGGPVSLYLEDGSQYTLT